MRIEESIAIELYDILSAIVKETALAAHDYLAKHPKIYAYGKYPKKQVLFPRDNPEYDDLYKTIPFLINDIPKYTNQDYPDDFIDYNGVFWSFTNKDTVDCQHFDSFKKLVDYVNANSELIAILNISEDRLSADLKKLVEEVVKRYLFVTKATKIIPDDIDDKLHSFICEKLNRFFLSSLNINLLIPICLATFEEDNIELNENAKIIRIPDDIQKARQSIIKYESVKDSWIAAAATHMIVFNNYHFENTSDLSINTATQSINAYPLDIIDLVFSAIRIVTGASIGYMQIITKPISWIDSFSSDLAALYGARTVAVNPIETEKHWLQLSIEKISKAKANQIKNIYNNLLTINDKGLYFAAKRLTRCMLRNEEDDIITDATIGLEALLSGGTRGEITYTISNRIPIVFTKIIDEEYNCLNSRKTMRKIYNFRSKIVHGGTLKEKDKTIEVNGNIKNISDVAIDFLRFALLFMIQNPKYLDSSELDNYIDDVLNGQI